MSTSKLQSLNKSHLDNIFSYLSFEEIFESLKFNKFFNNYKDHKETYRLYNNLVDVLNDSPLITEVKNLIKQDFHNVKQALKRKAVPFKQHQLPYIIGFFLSKIFHYISDNSKSEAEPCNKLEELCNKFTGRSMKISKKGQEYNDNKKENLARYLIYKSNGVISMNNLGVTLPCLLAITRCNLLYEEITKIELNNNNLGNNSGMLNSVYYFSMFTKSIVNQSRLKVLNLSRNNLNEKHMKHIIQAIKKAESLVTLDLSSNEICLNDSAFSKTTKDKDSSNSKEKDSLSFQIKEFLSENSSLISINFHNNILGPLGAGINIRRTKKKRNT